MIHILRYRRNERPSRPASFWTGLVLAVALAPPAFAEPPVELASVAAGAGGFVVNGIALADESGVSVAGAGDVDGDGLHDLIVGVSLADVDGRANAGQAFVVFGRPSSSAVDLVAIEAGEGGYVLLGAAAGDRAGWSVSGAGDVNGDGRDDLLVGAFLADPGALDRAGAAYVVFGKPDTGAVALDDVAAGAGGFVVRGAGPGDEAGRSVAGAGDIDGDGLDDVIVGAPGVRRDDVMRAFGACPACPQDVDRDGIVSFADVLTVLCQWGPCPVAGACCMVNGTCGIAPLGELECLSAQGAFVGEDTTCADVTCPQPGACCTPWGSCAYLSGGGAPACAAIGGAYQGDDTFCYEVECVEPGACCVPTGCFVVDTLGGADCAAVGGVYQGDDTTCEACPQPGACCLPDATCVMVDEVGGGPCNVPGSMYMGNDTTCADVVCGGACCLPEGSCFVLSPAACVVVGGAYQGDGAACDASTCP